MAVDHDPPGFDDARFDPREHLESADRSADEALSRLASALDQLTSAEESARRAAAEHPELAERLLSAVGAMRRDVAELANAAYTMKDFTESQLYLLDTLDEAGRAAGWPPGASG